MSKKIRLTLTLVREFEPNPDHYPPGSTLEDICELERINADDDLDLLFAECDSLDIKAEIIEGNE